MSKSFVSLLSFFVLIASGCSVSYYDESDVRGMLFVLPDQYRGLIKIVPDRSKGDSLVVVENTYIIKIPLSGVVYIDSDKYFDRPLEIRAQSESGENIPLIIGEDRPDAIALRGGISDSTGKRYFIVGTDREAAEMRDSPFDRDRFLPPMNSELSNGL